MKIKITAPTVVQLPPAEFDSVARGRTNKLFKTDVEVSGRIKIKEHTGTHYTGREILAIVTKVTDREIKFKKLSITNNQEIGKQNKRDTRRKQNNYKKSVFNTFI